MRNVKTFFFTLNPYSSCFNGRSSRVKQVIKRYTHNFDPQKKIKQAVGLEELN
jgi:hypothetical protein